MAVRVKVGSSHPEDSRWRNVVLDTRRHGSVIGRGGGERGGIDKRIARARLRAAVDDRLVVIDHAFQAHPDALQLSFIKIKK